jgi:uncharacterized protein YcbK (DUF882 family)
MTMLNAAVSRRDCLRGLSALALGGLVLPRWAAAALPADQAERRLSFVHTHTGERLQRIYWAEGEYLPEALRDINFLLRDFRNGEVALIDRGLLDQLAVLQNSLGRACDFHIISAYRSPATNNMLRSRSNGVARHSMHLDGRALDIRVPGVPLARVRDAALAMQAGGVGYYPGSDFVHVDTGRVRRWGG